MSLTKDGVGLLTQTLWNVTFLFFLCDKMEKFLQYKKCSTKVLFYFEEIYSLHNWEPCRCDQANAGFDNYHNISHMCDQILAYVMDLDNYQKAPDISGIIPFRWWFS